MGVTIYTSRIPYEKCRRVNGVTILSCNNVDCRFTGSGALSQAGPAPSLSATSLRKAPASFPGAGLASVRPNP